MVNPARWRRWINLCVCCCLGAIGLVGGGIVVVRSPDEEPRVRRAVALYTAAMGMDDATARIAGYRASIDAYPHLSGAYNNLAMLVLEQSGDGEQALALLERGLQEAVANGDKEDVVFIHVNMGYALRQARGRRSIAHCMEAIQHFDAALSVDPASIEAMTNKASALLMLGDVDASEALLTRTLELQPNFTSALIDLSHIHFKRGNLERALKLLDHVIDANEKERSPTEVLSAISNKAVFLREAGHTWRALQVQLQALEIDPDDPRTLSNTMTIKRLLCDWNGLETLEAHLVAAVTTRELSDPHRVNTNAEHYVSLLPYDSTLMELSDTFRRRIAQRFATSYDQASGVALLPSRWESTRLQTKRLRVGYLSFDFRKHPMGHLTLALVEAHNRRVVEVVCFSYGYNDRSEWRRRFEAHCDVFRDLETATDLEAAQYIARDQVDVLIDLMAHTKGARQGISALRPSRVVVNYLGFPGTTGSTFTDFALVDKQVMPPEAAATSMTESTVYLPTTYQANQYEPEVAVCGACHHLQHRHRQYRSTKRRASDLDVFASCVTDCQRSKRLVHGLPPDAIVFCNFNVNSKIDARSFRLWMNILRRVPESVLWLLAPSRKTNSEHDPTTNDDVDVDIKLVALVDDDGDLREDPNSDSARVKRSLIAQAAAMGVLPSRIVFAPHLSKQAHLARVAMADIFLDSLVYNAHSTASDALWAHVPIVSVWGDTFPSRVAASLITRAVSTSKSSDKEDPGLTEMVPHSLKDYEDLAVLLAHDTTKRLRLRAELSAQSLRCPLFDTKRTAEAVELALEAMHDVKKLGSVPQHGDEGASESGEYTRRDTFHVVVTPEQSRTWSDPERASSRLNEFKQRASRLEQAGDAVASGNVGARIALANLKLPNSRRQMDHTSPSISPNSTPRQVPAPSPFALSPQSATPLLVANDSGACSAYSDELRELERSATANPGDFSAFMTLAEWLCDHKCFETAVRVFETLGDRFFWTSTPDFYDKAASPSSQELERAFLMSTFALSRLGRADDAVALAKRALARYSSFFKLGYNLGALYRLQRRFSHSDAQQAAVAEAESRHSFATWSAAAFNRRHNLARKLSRRPEGSLVVALYCNEYSHSWWGSWGPSSVRSSGLGGSEEAVVFLSRELARLGYWVEVYGSPPPDDETRLDSDSFMSGGPVNVSWFPSAAYDPDDDGVDVFVAWRYSISLAVGKRARRSWFWAHDIPPEDTAYSALLETVAHRIVCVSSFQASLFPPRLRAKTVVLRNAVDDAFFVDGVNDGNAFVYASAPNRGLAQLLLVWPLIRRRLPGASLAVYYGFTPQFEKWAKERTWPRVAAGAVLTERVEYDEWRATIDALLRDTPGVTYVGLVDHPTLAQAYATAGFWLYPTAYPETSCISAMKAMANGAVPLTSRFEGSALSEAIGAFDQGPIAISSEGQLGNITWWGSQWAEQIAQLVGNPGELARLRANMKRFARQAYRWTRVAGEWHALILNDVQ